MHDDARWALPFAHLVDGVRHVVESDDLADARRRIQPASTTASSVPYQSCGCGPPPNCIVTPLCVAAVQSMVPASYHPPAAYTRAMNSHESTILCSRPLRPTHSKMTCVV